MTDFKNIALRELAEQQTRFAPPVRRQAQVAAAQKLLAEIESEKGYPYQYVCFRVTEYRPDVHVDLVIPGDVLRHDLELVAKRL